MVEGSAESAPSGGAGRLRRGDRAIIALLAPIGRRLIASLRVRLHEREHFTRLVEAGQPFIFVVWHSQLLLAVQTAAEQRIITLASPTRDGQIGAAVASRLGIESVTGDDRYESLSALRQLVGHLRRGRSLGLFPDGPSGPARQMKLGPLALARLTGCPLVPAAGIARWGLGLRSHWDRFILPLPFSRVDWLIGEPFWVPREADSAAMGQLARELEQRMAALGQRVRG